MADIRNYVSNLVRLRQEQVVRQIAPDVWNKELIRDYALRGEAIEYLAEQLDNALTRIEELESKNP